MNIIYSFIFAGSSRKWSEAANAAIRWPPIMQLNVHWRSGIFRYIVQFCLNWTWTCGKNPLFLATARQVWRWQRHTHTQTHTQIKKNKFIFNLPKRGRTKIGVAFLPAFSMSVSFWIRMCARRWVSHIPLQLEYICLLLLFAIAKCLMFADAETKARNRCANEFSDLYSSRNCIT